MSKIPTSWVSKEFSGIDLGDERLNKRLLKIAKNCSDNPSAPINQASDDWFDAKSSYRFFENDKITPSNILKPHFEQTALRAQKYPFVLAIQDTSVLDYSRHQKTKGLGNIGGQPNVHFKTQGLMMHATYILTPDGLPLGLLSEFIWSRKKEEIKESHYDDRKTSKHPYLYPQIVVFMASDCGPAQLAN